LPPQSGHAQGFSCRQRPPSRLLGRLLRCGSHLEWLGSEACLQILNRELHLQQFPIELFGGAAVLHALQVRDLKAQLLELEVLGDQEGFGGFELDAALEQNAP